MLGDEQLSIRVEREAFAVAQPGGVAFGGREFLPGLPGVVFPDAAAGFQLDAGIGANDGGHAVLRLATVGGRAHVDIDRAVRTDDEGMHRMVAAQRHAGDDHVGLAGEGDAIGRDLQRFDAVIDLVIDLAVIDPDAGAAGRAFLLAFAEALGDVRAAVIILVLQRHHEAAGRRLVVIVVNAAPGVDIHGAVGGHRHVAGMADLVGEEGGGEAGRQGDAGAGILQRGGAQLEAGQGLSVLGVLHVGQLAFGHPDRVAMHGDAGRAGEGPQRVDLGAVAGEGDAVERAGAFDHHEAARDRLQAVWMGEGSRGGQLGDLARHAALVLDAEQLAAAIGIDVEIAVRPERYPVEALERRVGGPHLQRVGAGFQTEDLRRQGIGDIDRPVGSEGDVVAHGRVAGEFIAGLALAALDVERLDKGARFAAALLEASFLGLVGADPQRAGLGLDIDAEGGAGAVVARFDEGFGFVAGRDAQHAAIADAADEQRTVRRGDNTLGEGGAPGDFDAGRRRGRFSGQSGRHEDARAVRD